MNACRNAIKEVGKILPQPLLSRLALSFSMDVSVDSVLVLARVQLQYVSAYLDSLIRRWIDRVGERFNDSPAGREGLRRVRWANW